MEYNTTNSREYREALQLINRKKRKATITDAQKELFSRYADSVREFHAVPQCLLFQNSFRLGARIMLDRLRPLPKVAAFLPAIQLSHFVYVNDGKFMEVAVQLSNSTGDARYKEDRVLQKHFEQLWRLPRISQGAST